MTKVDCLNRKGFTLTEMLIVIILISLMAVITVPRLQESFEGAKESIVETYNGKQIRVIEKDTNEILYEGSKQEMPNFDNYRLISIEYASGFVVMIMEEIKSE